MKVLAIETATAIQSVALLDDRTVAASDSVDACGSHARHLVPMIDRLLRSCGWSLSTLDGLVVSIGPGSFTGLRVGLATMLGFRSVTGLPLAAVPTLEGLCWNMHRANQPLCPVVRSRPGEVYWGSYRWTSEGRLERRCEEQVGPVESLAQTITEPTIVLGDGWQVNRDQVRRLLGARAADAVEAPIDKMQASAVSVGLAGVELLRQGSVAGRIQTPRYVQRAEAEIVFERRAAAGVMTDKGTRV